MTKAEQTRRMAWRFKVLQQAGEGPRSVGRTGRPHPRDRPRLTISAGALPERGSVFLQHDLLFDEIVDDPAHVARIGGAIGIQCRKRRRVERALGNSTDNVTPAEHIRYDFYLNGPFDGATVDPYPL